MAMIYEMQRGVLESVLMSLDYDSGLATIQYYNAGGVEITPTGVATISVSPTQAGENFKAVYPSALGQWASAFPVGRERILPANTEFAVVLTNTGTGNARAQYFLDFYEGGTDLPLA